MHLLDKNYHYSVKEAYKWFYYAGKHDLHSNEFLQNLCNQDCH